MTILRDLVPGSKSDRYSFASDSESCSAYDDPKKPVDGEREIGRSRGVTPRGTTPRGTTPRGTTPRPGERQSRSRDNTLRKTTGGITLKSPTCVNIGDVGAKKPEDSRESINLFSLMLRGVRSFVTKKNPFHSGPGAAVPDPYHDKRVVSKTGKINTLRDSQDRDLSVILKDLFISAIHLSWSWTIFNFFASFVGSWAFFAVLWYLIALTHGDFVPDKERPEGHKVCVDNVVDITTAFLFSVETQHTIGYGGRSTTSECPIAITMMSVQSIIGVFIDACMTGIVFAKFTKPTHRAKTILFSHNALVTMRNGAFYLLCRVGDLRPSHLIESHISGYIVRKQVTEEGEEIPYHLNAIEFGTDLDGTQDFFQLFWPIVLSHRIDESSPLWACSAKDLQTEEFEIVLTMEGTTPETGNNIQVRTSYLPCEILWGYKFEHSCVNVEPNSGKFLVTFDTLNTIVKDNTPRMSPQSYEEEKRNEFAETGSLCSHCSTSSIQPISAIPKAFFGKARTKNKTHKLPGGQTD